MLDLRLPMGAVRVTAPAAFSSAPGSVAVFDLCVAVTGTRLNTVRVIFDQVVDIVPYTSSRYGSGCITVGTDSYMHRVAMSRVRLEGWSSVRCRVGDD